MSPAPRPQKCRQRGSAVIEFVMVALFCVPLLLGTMVLGLDLIREMQVTQVARDAGRMYSNGIDFTQSANQTLLAGLAQGLNLNTGGGGNAVVIFSTLTYVDPNCNCTNKGQIVFVKRVVVGNSSIYTSSFGTPQSLDSEGNVTDYLTNSSEVANGFSTLLNLNQAGQYAFMAEMYVRSPGYDFWSYLGVPAAYARSIF